MFWSFRGYLGKIKSEKKNSIYNIYIYIYYILHVQCCVRVSASNFQVLTRKSGGARALGNIARFLAGPARSRTTNAESYQEFSLHWIISRNLLALNHIKKFPETESYQGFSLHWTTPRTFLTLNHIKKFPCTESHQEISLHWIISRNFPTLNHIKKFPYTASHQEICLHCITSRNFLTLHHIKKFPYTASHQEISFVFCVHLEPSSRFSWASFPEPYSRGGASRSRPNHVLLRGLSPP